MTLREHFEKILLSTTIAETATETEQYKSINPITEFLFKNTPTSLFRYRSFSEYALDAFDKDEIWLSSPSEFNDPYDTLFYFNSNDLEQAAKSVLSPEYIHKLKIKAEQQNTLPEQISSMFSVEVQNIILQNIKETEEEYIANALPNLIDLAVKYGKDQLPQIIRHFKENKKIACFSERVDNMLMWSHYAASHTGFAIEYDFSNGNTSTCTFCVNRGSCQERKHVDLYPVLYSQTRFDASSFADWWITNTLYNQLGVDKSFKMKDMLLETKLTIYKHIVWEYENEWRMMCSCNKSTQKVQSRISVKKPAKAIYLGTNTRDFNRKIISQIAKEKGIPVFEMYLDHQSPDYLLKSKQSTT